MDKKMLIMTGGMLVLVLIPIVIYGTLVGRTAKGVDGAFAQCLTDKGAKMYGAYWCAHCQSQKRMFGESFSKVNYIECSLPDGQTQTKECQQAGIKGYPTWEFGDGSRLGGEVSLENLAQKTGCSLEGGE